MLLDLASEWTGILHEAVAKAKMDEMRKNIAETWFAWSGPTEKGSAAYFRIQGPTVIIEYARSAWGRRDKAHPHDLPRSNERLRKKMVEAVTRTLCRLPLLLALLAFPSAVFAHRPVSTSDACGHRTEWRPAANQPYAGRGCRRTGDRRDRPGPRRRDFQERSGSLCRVAEARSHAPHGRANLELKLTASEFVPPAELRTGSGTIQMEFSAIFGSLAAGPHRLTLENRHLTAMSVYLINAAQPRFATVQITRQKRNQNQSAGKSNLPFIRSAQRSLNPVRGLEVDVPVALRMA